ncbi:acyltransferase family protein [uncultured Bacteroides sp.]|uniref:acyltransferase family protein n=1 Tax=uncultured Bacteroides sp. TaxID=162156 RepID=UPI002AA95B39|nr:acyltransferase family protein [uncultured Bacteroides sp.]
MERNKAIDIAKGIGIVAVVWGHLNQSCPIKDEIYLFHMPLFFMLSGYLFNDYNKGFPEFIKKKFKAYIIPYLFFFIIVELSFIILYTATGRSDQIFLSLGFIFEPYGVARPLWFFISIFWVQLIYYLICKYISSEKQKLMVSSACIIIGYVLYKTNVHIPLFIDSSLSMVFYFHIGKMLNKNNFVEIKIPKIVLIFFLGIMFFYLAIIHNIIVDIRINKLGNDLALSVLSGTSGSMIILIVSKYINKIKYASNILSYLGRNLLVIFSLHMLCFEIVKYLWTFSPLENAKYWEGLKMTVFGILFSLIIALPLKKIAPFVFK